MQCVAGPAYRAGYATRGMMLEFARKAWRQNYLNNSDFVFVLTSKKQNVLKHLRQDDESAVSRGAPGAIDDAVE